MDQQGSSYIRILELNNMGAHVREPSPEELISLAKKILNKRLEREETITDASQLKDYFVLQLGMRDQEVFECVFLDTRHRVISYDIVFYGSLDVAHVHPRELVKRAIIYNAGAVVFAHNHPSGDPRPSKADCSLTQKLRRSMELVDVRVLDHFVVAGGEATSFGDYGWQ